MATREVTLNEGMSLVRKQLEEQGQRILQLQRELERRTQELADTRNSLAGLVQERDADRCRFDEQLRAQADERQRAEERGAASERRLLEEVDRARQETKQARSALQDARRQHQEGQQSLQARHEDLSRQHRAAELELAALRERLASSEQREADLRRLLEDQKTATAAAVAQLARVPSEQPAPRRKRRASAPTQAKLRS